MKRVILITTIVLLLGATSFSLREDDFLPEATYSREIPTLQEVVGHTWGEKISSYHDIEAYLQALASASPVVQLQRHGETWQGRTLYHLIIASEKNLSLISEIKKRQQLLASGSISASELQNVISDHPAIIWLGYGIHGNETSSPEAALLTAYHLAASQEDEMRSKILENCVVLIDPLQNPDGRDRFVNYFKQTRGRWPDADPYAAEHKEPWPGGRSNHYLFDMNRDWFALTQPETQARVRLYLEWFPQVFVDFHEMSGNSTYYFAPPADPLNPNLTQDQIQWLEEFGKNNARWFDRMSFDYFTREIYDSFYPGYGEGWPMFHGSIGMTYEQASVRGLVLEREDETTLHFREAVQHHFIASLSTLENAADNRGELQVFFHDFRKGGIQLAANQGVQEFIFPPGRDPNRVKKLVNLLRDQGIQVNVARSEFRNESIEGLIPGMVLPTSFPIDTYIVPVAQPAQKLVLTLLERTTPMDDEFLSKQKHRRDQRLPDQIYDITAWSLPLIYDVDCFTAEEVSQVEQQPIEEPIEYLGELKGGAGQVAYLVPWGTNSAVRFLAGVFKRDLRVFSSDQPFQIGGVEFPRGSLVIKRRDNPENLREQIEEFAQRLGVTVYATDSGWVQKGVSLGSRDVHYLPRPSIALLYSEPTRTGNVGATRFLLERQYDYPVTVLHTDTLPSANLNDYNVLILPEYYGFRGGYSGILGERGISDLKEWVNDGGTLIAMGDASRWLTSENVGLLSTETEQMAKEESKFDEEEGLSTSLDELIQPEDEPPFAIPGALLRLNLDQKHWLAFGYDSDTIGLVNSRLIFKPLKLDIGRNIATYAESDSLVLSGLVWEESKAQLASKAYLMHESHGDGHIVAFAEDPNFRAFMDGLNMLFMNAAFLGPGH